MGEADTQGLKIPLDWRYWDDLSNKTKPKTSVRKCAYRSKNVFRAIVSAVSGVEGGRVGHTSGVGSKRQIRHSGLAREQN